MTYINKFKISADDSPSIDAFNRFRVSTPTPLYSSQTEYDAELWTPTNWNPWEASTSGAGSVTYDSNSGTTSLSIGTSASDSAVRQQHVYNRYHPGVSQRIEMTGVMEPKSNVTQRVGYFDAKDGLFFEHDGNALNVVLRSSVTGTSVDTKIAQSSWNLDKLDGSGKSGVAIDVSKTQIYTIDLQWLGVGRVRFGFNVDGILIYCHELLHANLSLTTPYMRTANLPVRYEIRNSATAGSSTTLHAICCAVYAEGAIANETGNVISVSNESTFVTVDTDMTPVLNIRPKLSYKSRDNTAQAIPVSANLITTSEANIRWVIFLNPTFTGGSHTWTDVSAESILQRDVVRTGTAVTVTGRILDQGYLSAASSKGFFGGILGGTAESNIDRNLVLTTNIDFSQSDIITIAMQNLGTGTIQAAASLSLREFKD